MDCQGCVFATVNPYRVFDDEGDRVHAGLAADADVAAATSPPTRSLLRPQVRTGTAAAERLGWTMSRFNRKLDNVCDKLDRLGVRGLRGGPGKLASNRRARLVEHAVFSRLVTSEDLPLLDQSQDEDDE